MSARRWGGIEVSLGHCRQHNEAEVRLDCGLGALDAGKESCTFSHRQEEPQVSANEVPAQRRCLLWAGMQAREDPPT